MTAGDSESGSYYAEQNVQTAVGAAMIGLSVLFVALRFYVRLRFNKAPLGWDDWLALAALVATVTAGLLVLMASIVDPNSYWLTANTDPAYAYTPANRLHLKLVYISSVVYFSIVCPAKLSILCLYRRVFSVSRSFHVQVLLLMTVVALFYTAATIASVFSCWPLRYGWVNTLNEAPYCFNFNSFWLATGVIEAVLDVCLIALPVGMITRLQMSVKKRMGVIGVFLLGAFGICTGVVKAYEGYVPGSRNVNSNATVVWSSVHGGMGIICACLPVCWPLILKMTNFGLLHSTLRTSSRRGSKSAPSVRRWRHDAHQPSTVSTSWASATGPRSLLGRDSRDELRSNNNKRAAATITMHTHTESELRRSSDVELPILAARAPLATTTAEANGVAAAAAAAAAAAESDGGLDHQLYGVPVYEPQVRIWSDAKPNTGRFAGPSVGQGIQIDKTVHASVLRRSDYPV